MQPIDINEPGIRQDVAAVVPYYNQCKRIEQVIHDLLEVLDHVYVVDDGSTDHGLDALHNARVTRVGFPENRGKGAAMLYGFKTVLQNSAVRYVVIVDSDGQHDPYEIPKLYQVALEEQADLVIGSRAFTLENVPWASRLGNLVTAAITACLLGRRISDTQSGFRLHSRRLVEDILQTVPGGRYETEMEILVKAVHEGYKVSTAPIQTIYEEGNAASHFRRVQDSFRIYRTLFQSRFKKRRKNN